MASFFLVLVFFVWNWPQYGRLLWPFYLYTINSNIYCTLPYMAFHYCNCALDLWPSRQKPDNCRWEVALHEQVWERGCNAFSLSQMHLGFKAIISLNWQSKNEVSLSWQVLKREHKSVSFWQLWFVFTTIITLTANYQRVPLYKKAWGCNELLRNYPNCVRPSPTFAMLLNWLLNMISGFASNFPKWWWSQYLLLHLRLLPTRPHR